MLKIATSPKYQTSLDRGNVSSFGDKPSMSPIRVDILHIRKQYEKNVIVKVFSDCSVHFTTKRRMLRSVERTPVHQGLNLIHCRIG